MSPSGSRGAPPSYDFCRGHVSRDDATSRAAITAHNIGAFPRHANGHYQHTIERYKMRCDRRSPTDVPSDIRHTTPAALSRHSTPAYFHAKLPPDLSTILRLKPRQPLHVTTIITTYRLKPQPRSAATAWSEAREHFPHAWPALVSFLVFSRRRAHL